MLSKVGPLKPHFLPAIFNRTEKALIFSSGLCFIFKRIFCQSGLFEKVPAEIIETP